MPRIFKYYGLRIDAQNRTVVCPFKSHKGGKERSPSFYFYPDTNSFNCFGCRTGGYNSHGCEFVSAYENISRVEAAKKILDFFATSVDVDSIHLLAPEDFSQRMEIMMDFSDTVREFRQACLDDKSRQFIEDICWVYDQHNLKRKYSNDALRRLVEQLKERISLYSCK